MKLAPNFKPHLAASKDTSRHILMNVCVRHGMAIATDGRTMVAGINADSGEETEPDDLLLPLPAVAAATKRRTKARWPLQNIIHVHEDTVSVPHSFDETTTYKRKPTDQNKFPNILKVMPEHANPVSITFSAKLLKQLSDAMGEESVCLTFDLEDTGKCFIVTPAKIHDRIGLLMPTRFGERGDTDLSKNKALERLKKLAKEAKIIVNP